MEVLNKKRIGGAILFSFVSLLGQKFYPDDPIEREVRPVPVIKPHPRELADIYDFFLNTMFSPAERNTPERSIRARDINTIDEVPDGAWYVNRHGRKPMTVEQLVRGSDAGNPPDASGPWKIISAKTEGITPGFTIEDQRGVRYVVKFDPKSNPEMTTAADVIGSRFFHALGYHVPENYLIRFDRRQLVIDSKTRFVDEFGKRRSMSERDVDEILLDVPRMSNGHYRAVASFFLKGKLLGPYRYHGTRLDDPNDTIPHEHRRSLRGLFVFAAWLGHDDSRAINTKDTLIDEGGPPHIRHYLIDFGSILGSASTASNSPRSGNEHLLSFRSASVQVATLGLSVPPWAFARYPKNPSIGLFEYERFDPELYRTEYPNPAFLNRLPDDMFWAAKQVVKFTDEQIQAIVKTANYSDEAAERWVTKCLVARRDKIGRAYFEKVLPIDNFRVTDGRLAFDDLAVKHGLGAGRSYAVAWSRFDNAKATHQPVSGTSVEIPEALRGDRQGSYCAATITAGGTQKTLVYFQRTGGGWRLAGVERSW